MLDARNQNVYIIAIVAKTPEETDIKYYLAAGGQVFDVSFLPSHNFVLFIVNLIFIDFALYCFNDQFPQL